jgi:hypothetical protein
LMLATFAAATTTVPAFPKTLNNARYVYVTSYDGDEYTPGLLPEDRQAIATVQDAIQKWGSGRSRHDSDGAVTPDRRRACGL